MMTETPKLGDGTCTRKVDKDERQVVLRALCREVRSRLKLMLGRQRRVECGDVWQLSLELFNVYKRAVCGGTLRQA